MPHKCKECAELKKCPKSIRGARLTLTRDIPPNCRQQEECDRSAHQKMLLMVRGSFTNYPEALLTSGWRWGCCSGMVQKLARSLEKDDSDFAPSADSDFEGPGNFGGRLKGEAEGTHTPTALVGSSFGISRIGAACLARQVQIQPQIKPAGRVWGCRMEHRHPSTVRDASRVGWPFSLFLLTEIPMCLIASLPSTTVFI